MAYSLGSETTRLDLFFSAMQLELISDQQRTQPVFRTPQELIHVRHSITLVQYKLWVLLLRRYRELYEQTGRALADGEHCFISTATLAERLGYEPKTSELRRDLEQIRIEPLHYNILEKDGAPAMVGAGFISEWFVSSSRVGVIFPKLIRQAVENLDSHSSIFHLINWSIFNSYSGKYEAILYALCKDYVGVQRTPFFEVEKYREYMGIQSSEYPEFKRLNQWVITGPVKKINDSELSDIAIAVNFKTKGRKVTGLWFSVAQKDQLALGAESSGAFSEARVKISHQLQMEYLRDRTPEAIALSIRRANEYIEKKQEEGATVNVGAIYRSAIKDDWGSELQARLDEQQPAAVPSDGAGQPVPHASPTKGDRRKSLEDDYLRQKTADAVKALTQEERTALVYQFAADSDKNTIVSFVADKGEFKDTLERANFGAWLRRKFRVTTIDPEEFDEWRKKSRR